MMFLYGAVVMMVLSYFGSWFAEEKLETYTFKRFTIIESITIGVLSWIGVFYIVCLIILLTMIYIIDFVEKKYAKTKLR